jgi:AraC family transcriptional regulator
MIAARAKCRCRRFHAAPRRSILSPRQTVENMVGGGRVDMLEESLLASEALPEAFECRVRGRMVLPLATVELHEYRFGRPQQALFESSYGFLDLALSRRPGAPRGRYVETPDRAPSPMGDVIFIPARHGLRSEWGAGSQRSICCGFDTLALDDSDGWNPDKLGASLDVRSPFMRDALRRLARELESPGFCSELMAEALCTQLSVELSRYFRAIRSEAEPPRGRLSPAQLRRIEEMLAEPGKPPSVAVLARACGLSARHFFRIFRASTGMTLSEFAAESRIGRAKSLLADGQQPIKQIAYRCGFETQAAFSAAFRRLAGVTPRDYRRQTMQ